MTEQATDPMIGRLLDGRYQVRSRIARGGMATVYLATDLRLERRVAIKVMHGHLADDSQFKERFIQEARSAARLAHPNVVNVFDQGEDSDMAYLVMEYLPGITLRDLLKEHKTLTAEQTLDILEAVLSGLAAAHRAGIVHRDLKPENVMLADDGRIKIGDFGLARAASANTATGAALLGTIAYLSPELVTRGVADTRSDIYAVGIMMYEMLAGSQPFTGSQPMQIAYQHANESVPPPSAKNPRVPAELDELVLWATAKDPAQRPRDAGAMLEQLGDTQRELATALPTTRRGNTGQQPTMAMPALPTAVLTATGDQPTQFIGTGPAPIDLSTATGRLTAAANRRRRRGWWAFALVLVLAAAAGGTGWYFGAGPGGTTTIPTAVAGGSPDAASRVLREAGLVVGTTTKHYSLTVASGSVIGTDPDAGSAVPKGSTVDLIVSRGPRPITMPKLKGFTLDEAKQKAADAGLVVDDARDTRQFTTKTPKDQVIAAYGLDADGNPVELAEGATYVDGGTVFFNVALGPVPDIVGMSQADAVTALANVQLKGVSGDEVFSDVVPAGDVVSYSPRTGLHPNDTVTLTISKGPDLVEIPENIVGDTLNSARQRLEALHFTVKVQSNLPDIAGVYDSLRVQSISGDSYDAATRTAKRGSTITITGNFGGGGDQG